MTGLYSIGLAATRRDVASAYAALSWTGGKVAASSTSTDVLATFDRLGPRSALAPSRAMLEALGAYAGANPRPSSTYGAAAAVASGTMAVAAGPAGGNAGKIDTGKEVLNLCLFALPHPRKAEAGSRPTDGSF